MSAAPFMWTPDRVSTLKRLYLGEVKSAGEIADVLGCGVRSVIRKVSRLGLAAQRPPGARLAELRRAQARAIDRSAIVRRERVKARNAALVAAACDDAALIAEAVAAGRVTVLPSGYAAGLTAWERATGYVVPPPKSEFGRTRFGAAHDAHMAAKVA